MANVPFEPEELGSAKEYVDLHSLYEGDRHFLIFKVVRYDIPDERWETVMRNLRLFFRWVKKTSTSYHFLFDVHQCDLLPLDRMRDVVNFLQKKKEILLTYLHSSVILIGNKLVANLLDTHFSLNSPTRPLKIIHVKRESGEGKENVCGIADGVWCQAMDFLRENLACGCDDKKKEGD